MGSSDMTEIHRASILRTTAFGRGDPIAHEFDPALRIATLRQQGTLCETRLVLGTRETMLHTAG